MGCHLQSPSLDQPTFLFFFSSPVVAGMNPPGLAEGEDSDGDDSDEENDVPSTVPVSFVATNAPDSFQDIPDRQFEPDKGKVAGNISRQEFRSFWVNELKADVWTMNVIQEGYKLPFTSSPGKYQERNNKSARQEKPYLISSVASLCDRGVVKKLQCRPWCTNPLTVSSRLVEGKIKKRLCIDLSRHVNLFLKLEAMAMNTLDKSLALIEPGDWMATYDLTSAFHHIPIHPDHHKYLGFTIENEQGQEEFYAYTCMPFGLATATQCLARVTKAITRFAALQGIRNSLVIDDGRIGAATKELCVQQLHIVLSIWKRAGFVISQEKSDTADTVSQRKAYLGFEIDTVAMVVSASPRKLESVKSSIDSLLLHPDSAPSKEVTSVVGKMTALQPAFGSVVQLLSRTAQQDLAAIVDRCGWRSRVPLSDNTRKCLNHFSAMMIRLNGALIPSLHNAVPLEIVLEPSPQSEGKTVTDTHVNISNASILVSDASDIGHCHYSIKHGKQLFHQGLFSDNDRSRSSGHRELLAVLSALRHYGPEDHPLKKRHVLWLTDSTNLCVFLTKGSKKPSIQADVLEVHWLCHELVIRLTPIHLKRDDYRIQVADAGSRPYDPDDWSIDKVSFDALIDQVQITVDAFAHTSNAKAKKFFSYGLCPGSAAIDAFTQDWSDEIAWLCPPVSLIIPTVKKLCSSRMSGILVVPLWRSAVFWTTLFPDGRHAVPQCWKIVKFYPHVVRGPFCYNPIMQGTTAFPFLAIFFVSAGFGYRPMSGHIMCPQ